MATASRFSLPLVAMDEQHVHPIGLDLVPGGPYSHDARLNDHQVGPGTLGGVRSSHPGLGAANDPETADALLDQYERVVLPSLRPIPNGTYTVELDGGSYVTMRIETYRKDPTAQRAVAIADSRNSLSFGGDRWFWAFALVRGRRAFPFPRLVQDSDIDKIAKPLRRLMMGLTALLRSSDLRRYRVTTCVRCKGLLTTPESIRRGVGPECERYLEERG